MDLETLSCKMLALDAKRLKNDLGERLAHAKHFHYLAQNRNLRPN